MLKLRLTRLGDKKRPSYRIVAMEACLLYTSPSPRD